jgi:hypothetical protein
MTDPLTTALGVYKGLTIAGKAKALVERFSNTTRFIAERDEMHREWTAETHARVAEHIADSREKFLAVGGTLEEHERRLEELFDQHETQLLAVLYAEDAYREAVDARRRMLSVAAASIVDLDLTIDEKARIEKVLRNLDPADVLELHKLSRAVGRIRRVPEGGYLYGSTAALCHALLAASDSDDALTAARCVRETILPSGGGWGGAGGSAEDVAYVTERGAIVLRVLRRYVDEKHDVFVGSGREQVPGSRSEVEARKVTGKVPGLLAAIQRALREGRTLERWLTPRFEPVWPTMPEGGDARMPRKVANPSPTAMSTLHLPAIPLEAARLIPTPEGHEVSVELADLPQYGRPATNVMIRGPFDVLRWLAEDIDARWW